MMAGEFMEKGFLEELQVSLCLHIFMKSSLVSRDRLLIIGDQSNQNLIRGCMKNNGQGCLNKRQYVGSQIKNVILKSL